MGQIFAKKFTWLLAHYPCAAWTQIYPNAPYRATCEALREQTGFDAMGTSQLGTVITASEGEMGGSILQFEEFHEAAACREARNHGRIH